MEKDGVKVATKISEFWTCPNPCDKDFRILDLPEPLRQTFQNFGPVQTIATNISEFWQFVDFSQKYMPRPHGCKIFSGIWSQIFGHVLLPKRGHIYKGGWISVVGRVFTGGVIIVISRVSKHVGATPCFVISFRTCMCS